MFSRRAILAILPVVLIPLASCAADYKADDSRVLLAALCPPGLGAPGILLSTTLNTSRLQESASAEATRLGLSKDYAKGLKQLRTRNSGSVPLPAGFACQDLKIAPRSDLTAWYDHGDWKDLQRRFPGVTTLREVSLPGYNRTRDLAIVEVSLSCGMNCGSDDFILLRKANGTWQRVAVTESSTS